jgi:hypothetical protein
MEEVLGVLLGYLSTTRAICIKVSSLFLTSRIDLVLLIEGRLSEAVKSIHGLAVLGCIFGRLCLLR